MKLVDILKNKFEILKIQKDVFFYDNVKSKVVGIVNAKELTLASHCRYWYDKDYLYIISNCEVKVYGSDFQIIEKVFDKEITPEGSLLVFFATKDYFLLNQTFDKKSRKLLSQTKIKFQDKLHQQENFYGKILNENFRLNFFENVLTNPLTFRCSDLLDTKTYWEYKCAEGEQVRGSFTVYKDKLLFYTVSEPSLYDYHYWVNVLDLTTGEVLFKISSKRVNSHFDAERGLFVTVSGTSLNQRNIKIYEIINVNTGERQLGDVKSQENFVSVGSSMQYLYKDRLYFIDNFLSIGGKKVIENPKIGCYDFIKKELLYFKEIPGFKDKGVMQILVNENKIYIRTSESELYIFEEDV